MAVPCCERHNYPPIISASDVVKYTSQRYSPPKGVIMSYQEDSLRYALETEAGHFVSRGLYVLENRDKSVGISLCGFGALHASMRMEELIELGSERFVSIGVAGGLQRGQKPGDIVVCTRAIRDEGISDHYLPIEPNNYVHLSPVLTDKLKKELAQRGISFTKGPTWTTATLYRETFPEVEYYQKKGVLTVELEVATLATVAIRFGVEVGAAFVISDLLANGVWEPGFHLEEVKKSLNELYQVAASVL